MSEPSRSPDRRWVGDYAHVGRRPLTAAERERLRPRRLRAWLRAALLPVALMAAAGASAILSWDLLLRWRHVARALGFLAPWLFLASVASGILSVRDVRRKTARDRRELEEGTVDAYEIPHRLYWSGSEAPSTLNVVTGSGRIVEGPVGTVGAVADVSEVAEGTANAYRLPVLELEEGVVLDRRRMTSAERDELRQRLAHDVRPTGPMGLRVIVLGALAGLITSEIRWLQPHGGMPSARGVAIAFTVAMAARTAWTLWKQLRALVLARRDLRDGVVLGISREGRPALLVELLPHSSMLWWERGAPADWRRRTRRSE